MYKVLLDENLSMKIKFRLQDVCEIYTVKDMGWNALENGGLINGMVKQGFDYLITSDKNLQYQQNIDAYPISFIVLSIHERQPMAAPPSPSSTELHTCPQPQNTVQKVVLENDEPRDFDKAIKGI